MGVIPAPRYPARVMPISFKTADEVLVKMRPGCYFLPAVGLLPGCYDALPDLAKSEARYDGG
jgi:hypothetical protein